MKKRTDYINLIHAKYGRSDGLIVELSEFGADQF
jgi:hypothetical protein